MTLRTARARLAAGTTTLRRVARAWGVPLADAYQRLYDRPMPPLAALPRMGRTYSMPRKGQRRPRVIRPICLN
ncbi:MAG: hypothetical protein WCG26_16490 [Chloroflexales bacterium]